MVKFISQFFMISIFFSQNIVAENAELHFWPTLITTTSDPMSSGVLYTWPDYSVVLHTKKDTTYVPVKIDNAFAEQLSQFFVSDENSPVRVERNASLSMWGLTIPGGARLRSQNAALLAPMTKKFTECLSTLTDDERNLMEDVIAFPLSVIIGGRVQLSPEHRAAAAAMFARFKTDRCIKVSITLQKKTEKMLAVLLCGDTQGTVLPTEIMAQTMLFQELLFSSQGIWVRITLAILQNFITERLIKIPSFEDQTVFEQDYLNFLDFVFTTKGSSNLTIEHYLSIANVLSLHTIADAFKSLPLKQLNENGHIVITTLHIGNQHSTLIRRGEQS